MAKGGARPVFGVVSSFIQRAYDQLSQDVAINNTPVVLNICYGGVASMTDATHLGWFDIALISNIPGWIYLAPTCKEEYVAMLKWAIAQTDHPVAIRQPELKVWSTGKEFPADYSELRSSVCHRGKDVAIIAAGSTFHAAYDALEGLKAKGIDATLVNPVFLNGVDSELLDGLMADHRLVVTMEDGILDGGYGEKVARHYGNTDMKVVCRGARKEFLDNYDRKIVMESFGLTAESLVRDIPAML